MIATPIPARRSRTLVFHRGSVGDVVAFTGRVLLRCAVIIAPFLISVAAFLAADTRFETVAVALLILVYCAIRCVGIAVIERSELAMIGAQQLAIALARRQSQFDLEKFAAALKQLRAGHEKSKLQAMVECGSLAILSYSSIWAMFGPG
jgi:hypothetical protein